LTGFSTEKRRRLIPSKVVWGDLKKQKSGYQKPDGPESRNGKDHATLIEGSKNCQIFQRRAIILPPVYQIDIHWFSKHMWDVNYTKTVNREGWIDCADRSPQPETNHWISFDNLFKHEYFITLFLQVFCIFSNSERYHSFFRTHPKNWTTESHHSQFARFSVDLGCLFRDPSLNMPGSALRYPRGDVLSDTGAWFLLSQWATSHWLTRSPNSRSMPLSVCWWSWSLHTTIQARALRIR
jgi:hypothetical protein